MNIAIVYRKEIWYDFISVWRTPGFVLPALAFPTVFYLFFGVFLNTGAASAYMLVTYACFGIMGPPMFNFAMNIASDRTHGWLTLKRLSPMPLGAYLLAKLSTALVFALVIIVALFSIAALLAEVRLATQQWLLLALVLLLGTLPFAFIGLILGFTLSDKAAPGVVNLLYLPMAFLSGLWLPITLLPQVLQHASWIWPSYHVSQIGLKVIAMDQGHALWLHLLLLIVSTSLQGVSAMLAFKRLT
ncbi:ABC transporter permease [Alkalimonas sp.]|uniref:ABC transporter permease n=1 Tax=Alkalimonas sp. TaxID=1872453 RepID=UPI00263BA736|nr:ABC transporter permease [Alkalimonas sp.]MCC5826793.1 ABC transporter permease [Alkalimonas sp.]